MTTPKNQLQRPTAVASSDRLDAAWTKRMVNLSAESMRLEALIDQTKDGAWDRMVFEAKLHQVNEHLADIRALFYQEMPPEREYRDEASND